MQKYLCDRLERYPRLFDDDDYGRGPVKNGIIFNPNNGDQNSLTDSTFEASSLSAETTENNRSFFGFRGGSGHDMCPASSSSDDTGYEDSPFWKRVFEVLGGFLIEGGSKYCYDSSSVPPPPLFGD